MEQSNRFPQRQFLLFPVALSIILFFCLACKYDPLKESLNGFLENDTLGVGIDTLPVELFTRAGIPVHATSIGVSPLGYLVDPVFGTLTADFITNIMWYQVVGFRDSVSNIIDIVDLKLELSYDSVIYGDITGFNFEVYEVTSDIPDSGSGFDPSNYYDNNAKINIEGTEKLIDTSAIVSVELTKEYATRFIKPARINDSSYYHYNIFRENLKGLYIKILPPKSGKGGLIQVSHANSTLTLRTSEKNTLGITDTISTIFHLADLNLREARSVNMYSNTPSSIIKKATTTIDTARIEDQTYIQALAGPRVLVRFPTLSDLRLQLGGKIIVNKAELILPINTEVVDSADNFNVPPYLGVYDSLTNGPVKDDGLLAGYTGGGYNAADHEYRIQIGTQIHSYFQDIGGTKSGNALYLFAADFKYLTSGAYLTMYSLKTPGRVVLNNNINTSKPPMLRIIYTKIPK